MPIIDDIDVLREVERGPLPVRLAQRERLLALRAQALALARESSLIRARACWRIVALDDEPGRMGGLRAGGHHLRAPRLLPKSGRLTALACAAATIGSSLENKVSELFAQRRASLAVALDGVGNELLFALSRRLQDRIATVARRQNLTVAGELRAGDPGLRLQAQHAVLDLAGAAAIGMALTGGLMMTPAKSLSMVQGVGESLPPQTWSRCDQCRSRERCTLAQAQAQAQAQGSHAAPVAG